MGQHSSAARRQTTRNDGAPSALTRTAMSTNPPDVRDVPGWLARSVARLTRLGFDRPGAAAAALTHDRLALWNSATNAPPDPGAALVVSALSRSAAPDSAVRALAQLAEAYDGADLRVELCADAVLRTRLVNVLGASDELGRHLALHPEHWHVLRAGCTRTDAEVVAALAAAVGADAGNPVVGSSGTPAAITGRAAGEALRTAYRRELLAIAGRDLAGETTLEQTTAALTVLADATLQAGLAVAAAQVKPCDAPFRLAVVAMGKAGGRELNYVSDVDVVFAAEPVDDADPAQARAGAERLAAALIAFCSAAVWEVDAALRPEGRDGPLVRSVASHLAYYERWAKTWEFQALLKARPAAGDLELGRRYVSTVAPLVWTAAQRPGFVTDVQAMRRRVVDYIKPALLPRELKLGPGGLRDVEFAVQLLQLVHGRADPLLQVAGTLPALDALSDSGFVGRDDAISLGDAYRFLRSAEHRVQLEKLRRTHLLPADAAGLTRLARAMGYRADYRGDASAVWRAEWMLHQREVRRLHQKLFYRPLLEAVARVPSQQLRLSPAQAQRRLAALGFDEPERALQHIDALTTGLSRRAAIQRALLPALLEDFSAAPDPDAGLLRYRRVSDSAGETPWYLRTLRDEGKAADRLAYLLGTSRFVADLLAAGPDGLRLLSDDAALAAHRSETELVAAMRAAAARQDGLAAGIAAVRAVRRGELVRIACADLLGLDDLDDVMAGLSATMDATLAVTLELASAAVAAMRGYPSPPALLAVIAVGRLGGRELGYGSDADVLFVYKSCTDDPTIDVARFAGEVAERVRTLLAAPSADPAVNVDANLRPEGRNGPLARTLRAYEVYYQRWSATWEAQALLRARACAGDEELGRRFLALIDPVRYPGAGIADDDVREIRRLKGRIDSERLPRGADPGTHTKLGRGGLGDIEWTAQLLQLRHGAHLPALRTPNTTQALRAAQRAGLLDTADTDALIAGWRQATHTRNAILLVRGKPGDQLPGPGRELTGVARALGYPAGFDPAQVDTDYRRRAARAREVVERVFYGEGATDPALGVAAGSTNARAKRSR